MLLWGGVQTFNKKLDFMMFFIFFYSKLQTISRILMKSETFLFEKYLFKIE